MFPSRLLTFDSVNAATGIMRAIFCALGRLAREYGLASSLFRPLERTAPAKIRHTVDYETTVLLIITYVFAIVASRTSLSTFND